MKRKFRKVIGTGGIGTGEIYLLDGMDTLGREESRGGHLLDNKDFCKLHIILHYIAVLTRDMKPDIQVIPVSAIGDDSRGNYIMGELKNAGMDVKYIKRFSNTPTLHSVCFQYSDGSGGNITENLSACSKVDLSLLENTKNDIDSDTIVLAAPEVPLNTRCEFIKLGAARDAFIAASFTTSEIKNLTDSGIFSDIDLLSINMDEARMFSGLHNADKTSTILEGCIAKLQNSNPDIIFTVTDGANGVFAYENGTLDFMPAYQVNSVNTAGAGDAFLAGMITGIINGMPITGDTGDSCLRYATALACMSVTSKDTIHFGITNDSLQEFISIHESRI